MKAHRPLPVPIVRCLVSLLGLVVCAGHVSAQRQPTAQLPPGGAAFLESPRLASPGTSSQAAASGPGCFDIEAVASLQSPSVSQWVTAAVGDALNDGTMQVVGATNETSTLRIVRLAPGGGTSVARELLLPCQLPAWGYISAHVADFDGDAKQDIGLYFRANNQRGMLILFLYRDGPTGSTWEERTFPTPETDAGYNMAVADFDGDRMPDVVTTDLGYAAAPAAWITYSDGLQFTRSLRLPLGPGGHWPRVAAGRIDGDDHVDLAVSSGWIGLGARLFRNLGNGAFVHLADLPAVEGTGGAADVTIGDVEGDGAADIVTSTWIPWAYSNRVAVYRQLNGGFPSPTVLTSGWENRCPVVGDLDGDGYVDVAVDNALDRTVSVFHGTPAGLDPIAQTLSGPVLAAGSHYEGSGANVMCGGDLDGDGRLDLVTSAQNAVLIRACDTAPPVITCVPPSPGWHGDNVTLACTASDSGSGLADPADASFSLSTSVPQGVETAEASTGARQVCDNAGNCATAGPVGAIQVDRRVPEIAVDSPAGAYTVNQPVTAAYSCRDEGSGLASCSGAVPSGAALPTSGVGSRSFTVTATDNVGNSATVVSRYTLAYATCLGYDPGKAVEAGATIPVKLHLCDAAGVDLSSEEVVVRALAVVQTSTGISFGVGDAGNANPGDAFRFTGGGYVFNLKTTDLATGGYSLTFTAGADPSVHSAPFQVR